MVPIDRLSEEPKPMESKAATRVSVMAMKSESTRFRCPSRYAPTTSVTSFTSSSAQECTGPLQSEVFLEKRVQ